MKCLEKSVLYSLYVIILSETLKLPATLKYKIYMFYISRTYQSTDGKKCCKYFRPEGVSISMGDTRQDLWQMILSLQILGRPRSSVPNT